VLFRLLDPGLRDVAESDAIPERQVRVSRIAMTATGGDEDGGGGDCDRSSCHNRDARAESAHVPPFRAGPRQSAPSGRGSAWPTGPQREATVGCARVLTSNR